MYESEVRLELEADTRARMRAVFGGHTCCRCGAPAERLSADEFYCGLHFPPRRKAESRYVPRVYHCSVALSD